MGYSGVFVFGDSLVDAGNALKLAKWYGTLTLSDLPEGAPSGSRGYFAGRFSDGYAFTDLVSNKYIGVPTKPIFPYFYEDPWLGVKIAPWASDPSGNNLNFAYGGAQIRQGKEVVPDLDGQTDAFRHAVDGDADPNALYMVTIGGNDVRSLVPSGSAFKPQTEATVILQKAAVRFHEELEQLIAIGVQNLVVTGVPNVGMIPRYDADGSGTLSSSELARSQQATLYSEQLDAMLQQQLALLRAEYPDANIVYVSFTAARITT
jgi:phospholipase/lecithinase/hemolysin